jgi:uncharacterized protein YbjT (DUF2867 family)
MILVFGATGQIGGELISLLAADGIAVRSVTRDPSHVPALRGLEWVKADLADPASHDIVFRGVTTMFLLTGNRSDMADLQIAAIRAAADAGVEAVVKLSALGASDHSRSPIGRAHHDAESALLSSGMRWTILRPHVFMQNLLGQAPSIVKQGRVVSASGDGRIPFIDTRDIAAVAAVALTQSGHDGKKYALAGPEALSYSDIARILSDVLSRPIAYHDLSLDDARERMARAGASSSAIDGSLALAAYHRAGGKTAIVHDTVRQVLGRPPRSFAEFVADHAQFFNAR